MQKHLLSFAAVTNILVAEPQISGHMLAGGGSGERDHPAGGKCGGLPLRGLAWRHSSGNDARPQAHRLCGDAAYCQGRHCVCSGTPIATTEDMPCPTTDTAC